jgi:hypothetical protein
MPLLLIAVFSVTLFLLHASCVGRALSSRSMALFRTCFSLGVRFDASFFAYSVILRAAIDPCRRSCCARCCCSFSTGSRATGVTRMQSAVLIFTRHLASYLGDGEYRRLQDLLATTPEIGEPIPATGGDGQADLAARRIAATSLSTNATSTIARTRRSG